MQILQFVGIAFVAAAAALILKGTKPELAFAVSIAGGVILLLLAFDLLKEGFSVFGEIAEATKLDPVLIRALLKMVGIGYLVEFSAGILEDFGQKSLADKLIFCGKVVVLLLALPILRSVLTLIRSLLEFIR